MEPGLVTRIFKFIFTLGIYILERFGILKIVSFQDIRSLLLSTLFEVNTTVPWGLFTVAEAVKYFNSWTRRKDGTINRKLADFFELKVPASEKPINGVSSKDVVIDQGTNVWARIFNPFQDSAEEFCPTEPTKSNTQLRRPILIYYHGGGFGVLCPDFICIDRFCRTISKTCSIIVVSVNYRRAPEHPYPLAYDDCFKALEWLRSSESSAHLPPMTDISQCFLAGDSAGGNIVHFMACRAAEFESEALHPLRIRGIVLLQPFFGSEKRTPAELVEVPMICIEATDWHWKAFLPKGADRDHPACNIFGPQARDISHLSLPPIFLITSSLDLMKDHHARYVMRIRQMGKLIKVKNYFGGVHGFYFFEPVRTKLALACLADMKEFIESCLDGPVHVCTNQNLHRELEN